MIKKIVSNALGHCRSCQAILKTRTKIHLPSENDDSFDILQQKLNKIEKDVEKLVLLNRAEPPIISCQPLQTSIMAFIHLTTKSDDYQLIKIFENTQQWVNQSLRYMNQEQFQQKQIRKQLINLRNSLQEFTQKKKADIKLTTHHKILDFLL